MHKIYKKITVVAVAMLLTIPVMKSNTVFAYDLESEMDEVVTDGYELVEDEECTQGFVFEDTSEPYGAPPASDVYLDGTTVETSGNLTDTISYSLKDGVLTISGSGDMPDYEYQQAPWFQDGTHLAIREVVIGENITSVGSYSFTRCYYIDKVTLPQSLKRINQLAFVQNNIKTMNIPEGIEELGYAAIVECTSLKLGMVNLPNIKSIGNYMFQNMDIDEIIIGSELSDMSSNAFSFANVKKLTVDEANPNFKSVDGVIYSKDGTVLVSYPTLKEDTSFQIGSDVQIIGEMAFCNNQYLTDINFGSVTEMKDSAFCYMENLRNVELPDSLVTVGMFTFYGSPKIESVKFGKSLKTTSYQMFRECPMLKSIDFGGLTELDAHTFVETGIEELDLPTTITKIGNACFGNCFQLEKVTTRNLEIIPYQSFLNCKKLEVLNLNEGIQSISRGAFLGAFNIEPVTIPWSVIHVYSDAFEVDIQLNCLNPNMEKYGNNGYLLAENINIDVMQRYDYAFDVLELVNQKRQENGLQALTMDTDLLDAAMLRAAEITMLFSHTRPDSSICFTACQDKMIAENIAYGQTSPEGVMESWMNSEGHKDNILNSNYYTIGIGCIEMNGVLYWVQCFGTSQNSSDCAKRDNNQVNRTIQLAMIEFGEAPSSSGIIFQFGEQKKYKYESKILAYTELAKGQQTVLQYYVKNPGNDLWVPVNLTTSVNSMDANIASVTGNTIAANNIGSTKLTVVSPKAMLFNAEFKVDVVNSTNQYIKTEIPGYEPPKFQAGYYDMRVCGGEWNGTNYTLNGKMITNSFFCDGTYTYFLQADGTPMKDRLTYHPDGLHVIYFDQNGHEVFSNFAHISKSIAGADVDDYCFFDSCGYMYVDTLTYDMTGTKLYYINEYGVLERGRWFCFSGKEFDKGLGFSGRAGGYGYANADFSLMTNTYTYDWDGNYVYIQGDGHMFR
ncbi:MAG: leucine-rich repeat protein [Lachnospiraceae bacterium]|nr:leucine-rich repeat protein [Lachnospiraceae bacterium]